MPTPAQSTNQTVIKSQRISPGFESCHEGQPPLISVIIPVFNAASFIIETLDSIKNQTLRNIEIICIDDCSTDQSLAILRTEQQCDPRITLLTNETNQGAGISINRGLSVANGKYIQIVGNDDLLAPDTLEFLFNYCETEGLDFCQYGVTIINDNPRSAELKKRAQAMKHYHRVEHSYHPCPGIELLILLRTRDEYRMTNGPQITKRTLLQENDISNLEGIHHEDMYFTYRTLLCSKKATLIQNPFYSYRIRENSVESGKALRAHTAEEFYSLFYSALTMMKVTPAELFQYPAFKPVIEKYIFSHLKRAAQQYWSLSETERTKIPMPDGIFAAGMLEVLHSAKQFRQGAFKQGLKKIKKKLSS